MKKIYINPNLNNFFVKTATRELFRIFGGSFFAHTLPETLTKHNIKETSSKGNI